MDWRTIDLGDPDHAYFRSSRRVALATREGRGKAQKAVGHSCRRGLDSILAHITACEDFRRHFPKGVSRAQNRVTYGVQKEWGAVH